MELATEKESSTLCTSSSQASLTSSLTLPELCLGDLDFYVHLDGPSNRICDRRMALSSSDNLPQLFWRRALCPYPDSRPDTQRSGRNCIIHSEQSAVIGLAVNSHFEAGKSDP